MADFPMEAFLQASQQRDINEQATNPPLGTLLAQGITKGVETFATNRQKEREAAKATMLEFVKNEVKDKDFVDASGNPYDANAKMEVFQQYSKGNFALKKNQNTGAIEVATKKGEKIGSWISRVDENKLIPITPTQDNIEVLKKSYPGLNWQIGVTLQLPTTTFNKPLAGTAKPQELPEDRANRIKEEARLRAEGSQEARAPQVSFEQENKLRDDFRKDTGDYSKIRDSYTRIQASAKEPSAAGDLALIFNYMKILDPGSVVREGEFATAQNSGSVPDIIIAKYNKVKSGERLSPSIRADFVDRASKLYQGQEAQYKKVTNDYTERAKSYGLDPNRIMTDYSIAEAEAPKKRFQIIEAQ